MYVFPGSPSRLLFEEFFHKDYCFRKGLVHQQFQGPILLMVGLTSRVFVTQKNIDLSQLPS